MKDIEARNREARSETIYKIQGKKATYEFLIEQASDGTYRAYPIRMWGDADPRSRGGITYTNDYNEHNYYITRKEAPRSTEEALNLARQWVNGPDQSPAKAQQGQSGWQIPWGNNRTANAHRPQAMKITREIWKQIEATVGTKRAETGGPLGGSREGFIVEHFYFDSSSMRSGVTYSPDDTQLNRLFREDWNPRGIYLLGFVHSHPDGIWRPSGGDLAYAKKILHAIPDLDYLLLPIVQSKANTGRFNIFPYAAVRRGNDVEIVQLLELEVVEVTESVEVAHKPTPSRNTSSPMEYDDMHTPVVSYTEPGTTTPDTRNDEQNSDPQLRDNPNNDPMRL